MTLCAPAALARSPSGRPARRAVASKAVRHTPSRVVRGRVKATVRRNRRYLTARRRVIITLLYARGRIVVRRIDVTKTARPKRISLFTGRFVARLYKNKRLARTIEFDFPLLGAAATFTKQGAKIVKSMAAKMRTMTRVELPWDVQADSVTIFDKATRKVYPVPLISLKHHPLCRPGQMTRNTGKRVKPKPPSRPRSGIRSRPRSRARSRPRSGIRSRPRSGIRSRPRSRARSRPRQAGKGKKARK